MPRVFVLNLISKARSALKEFVARGANWRERQRAQTLLHLDDGLSTSDVAQIIGIHAYTVSRTRRDWIADGLVQRFTNELTNEIDGFVRQARRKPQP